MEKLSFQLGRPTGVNMFARPSASEEQAQSSADSSAIVPRQAAVVPQPALGLSPGAIDNIIATATGRTTALHGLAVRDQDLAAAAPQHTSERHLVGDVDAQHIYEASACVFVAK